MAPVVALTGFMACGKSVVGRAVAERLGWRFADLDAEIQERTGRTVAGWFDREGESAFREVETRTLGEVLREAAMQEGAGLVLALGGGAVTVPASAALVREAAFVVYLAVDAGIAWRRVRGNRRPLATDEESFRSLAAAREGAYLDAADTVVECGERAVAEVAAEVAALVAGRGAGEMTWRIELRATRRPSVIVGGAGALSELRAAAERLAEGRARVFTITDTHVGAAWGELVARHLAVSAAEDGVLTLPPGETTKRVEAAAHCWEWLAVRGARRDDVVVALGGGVVGDLAGFVAATYVRGVGFWQVPTSLLAQVDSSVGGKVAIDLVAGKNLVGAFYQPDLVVVDPDSLATLPGAEFAAGLGEVVKYALLAGETLLGRLETDAAALLARDVSVLGQVVRECVAYKSAVVESDELDQGPRAVLNLGHTIGHALEVTYGYGVLAHGVAVGLGTLAALAVSERVLGLDPDVRRRTTALLERLGLPTVIELPLAADVLRAAGSDKKVSGRGRGFVCLRAIGEPVWGVDVPDQVFVQGLEVIAA